MVRRCMASLGLALGLTATTAVGKSGSHKKKKKAEPTYRLVFDVEKASYGSTISVAGLSQSESDNFKATATYPGIKVPGHGSVSIKRASQREEFSSDGNGPEFEKTGSGGLDCHGDLYSDPTLPPLVTGSSTNGNLSVKVELAKSVLVEHVTGHTSTSKSCDQIPFFPNGSIVLVPASQAHPKAYMPAMLTAKLSVSLGKLRKLQKDGKALKIDVDSTDNIVQRPPADCSIGADETCDQHIGWRGFVEIARTG